MTILTNDLESDLEDRLFWMPTADEIKNGSTADVYFEVCSGCPKVSGINPKMIMEVFTRKFPSLVARWVVCGIYEVERIDKGLLKW